MKIFKYIIIALFFIVSCQSEPDKTVDVKEEAIEKKDPGKTLVVPWNAEINDTTHVLEIRRDPAANMNNLQPGDIVDALNIKHPEIRLSWVKLDGNKAFVTIADATYLTQQAGTEGARAYLAEATYSLTEIGEIDAVDFQFKEGDHAIPGVYTRDDFHF